MHAPSSPFKQVSSLETLCGDPEQCRREIKTGGHGGCWADREQLVRPFSSLITFPPNLVFPHINPIFNVTNRIRCVMHKSEDLRAHMEKKYAQLESVCVQHGLSLKEYHLLICCFEGQMSDGEICRELSVNQNQLNDLVDGLKARALIGRKKGILVASIEGRSAYYDVPPLAA